MDQEWGCDCPQLFVQSLPRFWSGTASTARTMPEHGSRDSLDWGLHSSNSVNGAHFWVGVKFNEINMI